MGLKILLLGGTGAMGVYCAEQMKAIGAEVYITSRKSRQSLPNLHFVTGDAHDLLFLRDTVKSIKPDVVIDFMVYATHEFLDRYKMLLSATGQYIFLSTYRVFADNQPLIESSPRLLDVCADSQYLSTDEYGLSKARQENILLDSGKTNWTIIRPSITYSKNRFQFGCLEAGVVCYRALNGLPVIVAEEMLDKYTTLTWAGDVAKMICRLLMNDSAMGEIFNVVTSEHHTWREVAELYNKAIGLNVVTVPLERYLTVCAKYQTIYDRMFNRIMDNSKVLRVTGLHPQDLMPLAVGLTQELEHFKKSPQYQYGINYLKNAQIDKFCNTRIPLNGCTIRQKLNYLRLRYKPLGVLGAVGSALKNA